MLWLAAVAGCGYLSNDLFFSGEGVLRGRLTRDGAPAAGARLVVLGVGPGVPLAVATADADGRFELVAPAGQGRRALILWGEGFGRLEEFDLAGEGLVDLGVLALQPTGLLAGRVELGGQSPELAQVEVSGAGLVARPRADGAYSLRLPAGRYELIVHAPGFLEARLEGVEARAGESRAIPTATPPEDTGFVCQGGLPLLDRAVQGGGGQVDLLFVVDNSGSMVGEQLALGESFGHMAGMLLEAGVDHRTALVTTGMESEGCPPCSAVITGSCMNETGESGRFQDRRGKLIDPDPTPPVFDFETDPACRVAGPGEETCVFDPVEERGTALVGVNGCGYERGLAAMRRALSEPLRSGWNAGFLRATARLAVVMISDEEDCGEVGEVTENLMGLGSRVCYAAARGAGPDGASSDPEGKPYALTPVEEYAAFLGGLKPAAHLVSFSAVVGVEDPADPDATRIRYESTAPTANVLPACQLPGCQDERCQAYPGTRYARLARLTGGAVDSICQTDFSPVLERVLTAGAGVRRAFPLRLAPLDPGALQVRVDGLPVAEGWSFDPGGQAVVFEDGHLPPALARVEIVYTAVCP
jgi:hypothetical protein